MTNLIKKNRKKYSPQFKFDRAIDSIKKDNLSEISRQYGVSVNLLSNWRMQLTERGSLISPGYTEPVS